MGDGLDCVAVGAEFKNFDESINAYVDSLASNRSKAQTRKKEQKEAKAKKVAF